MKNKKPLIITLIALDAAITIFLFVISIIMLASTAHMAKADIQNATGLIGEFQKNPGLFLGVVVIPLFLLLAGNIIGLVIYVKKTTKKEAIQVSELTEAEKEALKAELFKDFQEKK